MRRYIFWAVFTFILGFSIPFASFKVAQFAYQRPVEDFEQAIDLAKRNINTPQDKNSVVANRLDANVVHSEGFALDRRNVSLLFVGDII